MFKRTWIVVLGVMALGVLISACGGGDLAEDLTPIPTLPQGEEPELVEALQVTPEPPAADTTDGGGEAAMGDADLVALGEETFAQCASCHGDTDGAGPALIGMGERAATRVGGMSAEDYLHESIVDPGAYVVDGFSNIMPPTYGDALSEQEIQGVIAYILSENGGDSASAGAEMQVTEEPESPASEASEPAEDAESDAVTGDAANGETLFAGACAACHGAEDSVGPALPGMGERAADRVEGLTAVEYLHESIVDPGAYIVDGYTANIMPPTYGEQFDEQQLQDIVAYILSE